tara:strand:- start:147 stop:911 length:765 start_codon:yes stop_codon:yes gene_type:complete
MKEKPSVDVIIPNYNKSDYIEEAINSVINQTYKNWFLYIIDDNSSDDSLEKINKYSDLQNVKIITLKKNKGPAFARNYGMRISKSKYISFLDSDDGWDNNKLEKQINFMEEKNLTFTYTDYVPFYEENGKRRFKKATNLLDKFNYDKFIKNTSINTTTMIILRSIISTKKFKKVNLEDYLFKCEILKMKNIIAIKLAENLAFYRIVYKSRSRNRLKNIFSLWSINRDYNKLNLVKNVISIFFAIINSIRKYGIK